MCVSSARSQPVGAIASFDAHDATLYAIAAGPVRKPTGTQVIGWIVAIKKELRKKGIRKMHRWQVLMQDLSSTSAEMRSDLTYSAISSAPNKPISAHNVLHCISPPYYLGMSAAIILSTLSLRIGLCWLCSTSDFFAQYLMRFPVADLAFFGTIVHTFATAKIRSGNSTLVPPTRMIFGD